jgi:hypothetical protein
MNSFARRCLVSGVVAVAAGAAAFSEWSADREACPTAREFSDSLASNGTRLSAVDSVLARFDLEDRATTIPGDSSIARGEPNRLERRIIALRMEGVTAPQIDRWMKADLHLAPRADDGRAPPRDISGQITMIRARESDPSYVRDLRRNFRLANDYWHDMTGLRPITARWLVRCSAYHRTLAIAIPLFALATAALLLFCWRWLRTNRRRAP